MYFQYLLKRDCVSFLKNYSGSFFKKKSTSPLLVQFILHESYKIKSHHCLQLTKYFYKFINSSICIIRFESNPFMRCLAFLFGNLFVEVSKNDFNDFVLTLQIGISGFRKLERS